jgi:PAS domain S-box-containing protein
MNRLETFKAVFDSAPDGVIIISHLGKILLVNQQTEHLFGYTNEELEGKDIELLIPKRYHHNHQSHKTEFISNPTVRKMGSKNELWACRKDGSEFAAEISLSPVNLSDKTIITAVIRDVTERKKAEEEIALQNKKLQIQYKELEQFAYIASHDLQEPLRTIVSFSELLETQCTDDNNEAAKTYIKFISNSSKRMQQLIKGLLDYSRVGKHRELSYVDCNLIVSEVISDLNSAIQESNAQITVGPLPSLNAYALEIRLLFQNLISNALKFRHSGTTPTIKITAKAEKKHWHFTVQDNGIGISEEDCEKIFIIFKRLHNRNEYEGIGIGLSHCKKIIELHGGEIWVESKLNEGSTFNFTIPNNKHL